MKSESIDFLLRLLNQVTLNVSADDFEEISKLIIQVKNELLKLQEK